MYSLADTIRTKRVRLLACCSSEFLLVCETGRASDPEPVLERVSCLERVALERVAITSWINQSTTLPDGKLVFCPFETSLVAKEDEIARLHPDRSRRAV